MALQTNDFFGKDGTAKWWIGQVPLGQEINKVNATKWGDRVQVRILGSDPASGAEMNDRNLRWAMILRPGSQGTLNQGATGIIGGEWVVGIFLDDEKESCMILGVIGRSDPKYYVTYDEEQQAGSTEFRPTLNYWGAIKAQVHQMSGAPDTPVGIATLNVPSASDYYQFNLPPRIGIAT